VDLTLQRLDKKSDHLKENVDKFFAKQKNRIVKRLREEFKSSKDVTQRIRKIFDVEEEKGLTIDFIVPYITEYLRESGQSNLLMLDPGKEFIMSARVERFIRKRSEMFAKEVSNYTLEGLERTLSEGIESSEGIQALSKRVADMFGEYSSYRSERIARTEATAANNEGSIEAFKQSEIIKGKEWIATMDARTREEHAALNGEIVGLNDSFSNGLQYPSEPNCRCVVGPTIES